MIKNKCCDCGKDLKWYKSKRCLSCSAIFRETKGIPAEQRFWARVDKNGPIMPGMTTPCWVWTKACNDRGYGEARFQSEKWLVHRIAYWLHYGPFPKELDICHHCDNPSCVNPEHLFAGTAKDNILDMMIKGRARGAVGIRNASAKLTEDEVIEIRNLHGEGMSYRKLAKRFNIRSSTIARIIKRKNWKHLL